MKTSQINLSSINCRWCPNSYQVNECNRRHRRRHCMRRPRHLIRSIWQRIITRRHLEESRSTRRGWIKDRTFPNFRCIIIKWIKPTITIMTMIHCQFKVAQTVSQEIVPSRITTRLRSRGHRIQKLAIKEGIHFKIPVREAPILQGSVISARHQHANPNFTRMISTI